MIVLVELGLFKYQPKLAELLFLRGNQLNLNYTYLEGLHSDGHLIWERITNTTNNARYHKTLDQIKKKT